MNRTATNNIRLAWTVTGVLKPDVEAPTDWFKQPWIVVLPLMLITVIPACLGFFLATGSRKDRAPGTDVGLELVALLKAITLIAVAAIGLTALLYVTDNENLSALFGLLGAIAGYLAGNRAGVQNDDLPPAVPLTGGAQSDDDKDGPSSAGREKEPKSPTNSGPDSQAGDEPVTPAEAAASGAATRTRVRVRYRRTLL